MDFTMNSWNLYLIEIFVKLLTNDSNYLYWKIQKLTFLKNGVILPNKFRWNWWKYISHQIFFPEATSPSWKKKVCTLLDWKIFPKISDPNILISRVKKRKQSLLSHTIHIVSNTHSQNLRKCTNLKKIERNH